MTTLVATVSDKYACILSESQVSDDIGGIRMPTDSIKVVRQGSWLISGCGWVRASDVVQHITKWPSVPPKLVKASAQELTEWIIKRVVPIVRLSLENEKSIDFDKGMAQMVESEFLIATHGKVFSLDEGFGVTPINNFYVSGSGGKIALGAIHALRQQSIETSSIDVWNNHHDMFGAKGVEAAMKFDLYSSGTIRGYKSYPNGMIKPFTL
jgi:hypothetical protein